MFMFSFAVVGEQDPKNIKQFGVSLTATSGLPRLSDKDNLHSSPKYNLGLLHIILFLFLLESANL